MLSARAFPFLLPGGMATCCCAPQRHHASPPSLCHCFSNLPKQTKAVLATLFCFGPNSRRRLQGQWQVWEPPVWWQRRIHDYKENLPHSFRAESDLTFKLNMLPAHPKYSSGARRAAPRCADPPAKDALTYGPAWPLASQRKASPSSARVGNGAQWVVGHKAQVALAAEQLRKILRKMKTMKDGIRS